MISVSVSDLQPIVVEGLRAVLAQSEELELVGSTDNLDEALQQLETLRPTILMVDRAMGLHVLLEWLAAARRSFPDSQLVVWSASNSDVESFRLLQAGARGILRKGSSIAALYHCLRTVARKEMWTESLFGPQMSRVGPGRTRPLTPREQQVADLVAKGMKNREIAEALHIATGTVKIHLMHIFEKTGIRDRFELALHGLRLACEPPVHDSDTAKEQKSAEKPAPVSVPD